MKKYKAEFIRKVRDKYTPAVHLFYKYRGQEYMITDEHNGYSESIATKHYIEQKQIDDLMDKKPVKHIHEEDAQIGIDKIFNYFETGAWEE